MEVKRLGVHRSWNVPRITSEIEKRIQDNWRTSQAERLDEFIHGKRTGRRGLIEVTSSLWLLGLDYLRRATRASLASQVRDVAGLALGTSYEVSGREIEGFLLELRYKKPDDATHGFASGTMLLAQLLSLGWIDVAQRFGDRVIGWLLKDFYYDARAPYRNCAAWFVMRVFCEWRGQEVMPWPERTHQAPIYDALLATWREPEEAQLNEILLAACDWHTHECWNWSDRPDQQGDFSLDTHFAWPIEIHMVFRLRESLGLRNPKLDHPLMQTALGEYRPPVAVNTDARLEAVVARVVEMYPELADRLALVGRP
ncbi:MAG TPA: hypothetical protein VI837_04665 [Blastocatellia bacterium]|nr:hypothetical protein [Blastocatellia bacterium]